MNTKESLAVLHAVVLGSIKVASGRMDSSFFLFLPVRQVPPLLPTAKGCVLGREKLDLLYAGLRHPRQRLALPTWPAYQPAGCRACFQCCRWHEHRQKSFCWLPRLFQNEPAKFIRCSHLLLSHSPTLPVTVTDKRETMNLQQWVRINYIFCSLFQSCLSSSDRIWSIC